MPTRSQTTAPENKADIRYYGIDQGSGAASDLVTDLGQYERTMTLGTDCVYEPSTVDLALTGIRTIAMHLWYDGATGTLWSHGGTGGNLERMRITGGNFEWVLNASTIATVAVPAEEEVIIKVSTEPNPAAAGAGDAMLSFVEIYGVTSETLTRTRVRHAVKAATSTDAIIGASATTGTSSYFTAGGYFVRFRYSSRVVPFTEIRADWVTALSAISNVVARRVVQGLPLTESSGIGNVAEMHGPAVQVAAHELAHAQWRTMGALMNWRLINVPNIDDDAHTSTTHREKIKLAPGGDEGTGFRIRLGWFGAFPVHPFCNALFVQVFARCWNVTDADLRTFGFRMYSFNKRPAGPQGIAIPGEPVESLDYRFAEATFTSDEAEPGSWRIQAVMPICVGQSGISKGATYLALAYAHDLLNQGAETFRINVKAIHAVQLFNTTVGLPPGGGPAGESG